MIYAVLGLTCFSSGVIVWYLWKVRPHRLSVTETLSQFISLLPLQEARLQKYPMPTVVGNYFGFRLALEGNAKKQEANRKKGFRFLATLELPKALSVRIFLQGEGRKTSFKPIADLKWVATETEGFQKKFLLLASDESRARAVFQPYLCQKILALSETHWQLDAQKSEAHFEVWQEVLNSASLSDLLRVVIEVLHSFVVLEENREKKTENREQRTENRN